MMMYRLLETIFPSLTWRYKSKEKVVYLTFDDGPNKELTPFVLDNLKSFNAKATFFLTGQNVVKEYALFEQIKTEGHSVGNHSYSHLNGWMTTNKSYFSDIDKCDKILNSKLFRPPYGKIRPSQINFLKKKYEIIMWDVLSWDFDTKISAEKCLSMLLKKIKSGSIVVFHENEKSAINMKFALPRLLQSLKGQGFTFKTL